MFSHHLIVFIHIRGRVGGQLVSTVEEHVKMSLFEMYIRFVYMSRSLLYI